MGVIDRREARLMPLSAATGSGVSAASSEVCRRSGFMRVCRRNWQQKRFDSENSSNSSDSKWKKLNKLQLLQLLLVCLVGLSGKTYSQPLVNSQFTMKWMMR